MILGLPKTEPKAASFGTISVQFMQPPLDLFFCGVLTSRRHFNNYLFCIQ
jgi:hypothetical protein